MSQTTIHLHGFALLTTVMSLLAFSIFLTLVLAKFSLGINATAQTVLAGTQALVYADSCTESVLNTLRGIPDMDDMHVTLPNGIECTVVVERDDTHFTIQPHVTVGTVTRSMTVEATRDTNFISVSSWSEQ